MYAVILVYGFQYIYCGLIVKFIWELNPWYCIMKAGNLCFVKNGYATC